MKYIKLFEKFESGIIKSVLSFLSSKLNKAHYNTFITVLRYVLNEYHIPLSDINDSDIQYLNFKKALSINNKADNELGIYYLKFWFSVESGYIGTTTSGNKTMKVSSLYMLDDEILKWLYSKSRIGGIIEKIGGYSDLNKMKTGDKIVFSKSGNFDKYCRKYYKDYLILGELYIDNRGSDIKYYVYSDDIGADGSEPTRVINGIDRYENKYLYSFRLFNSEVSMINRIIVDKNASALVYKNAAEESPWDFNLPRSGEWESMEEIRKYEKADFGIVLNVNNILSEGGVQNIRKRRQDLKDGATAFINDDKFKQLNIKRYLTAIFNRFNINSNNKDFKNINKVVRTLIYDNLFIIFTIRHDASSNIDSFIYYLFKCFGGDNTNYDLNVDALQRFYFDRKKYILSGTKNFQTNYNFIKEDSVNHIEIQRLKEVIDRLLKIGNLISNYYKTYDDIKNVSDLQMELSRLGSVENFMSANPNVFSYNLRNIFEYIGSDDYFLQKARVLVYNDDEYQKDLEKIKALEKYVSMIFK